MMAQEPALRVQMPMEEMAEAVLLPDRPELEVEEVVVAMAALLLVAEPAGVEVAMEVAEAEEVVEHMAESLVVQVERAETQE